MKITILILVAILAAACASGAERPPAEPTTQPTESPTVQIVVPPTLIPPTFIDLRRPTATVTVPATATVVTEIVHVEVGDFFFRPQKLVISVGTTVEWVPVGNQAHSVDSKLESVVFGGAVGTRGGSTYTIRFNKAGEFPYDCRLHPGDMDALIIVKESN